MTRTQIQTNLDLRNMIRCLIQHLDRDIDEVAMAALRGPGEPLDLQKLVREQYPETTYQVDVRFGGSSDGRMNLRVDAGVHAAVLRERIADIVCHDDQGHSDCMSRMRLKVRGIEVNYNAVLPPEEIVYAELGPRKWQDLVNAWSDKALREQIFRMAETQLADEPHLTWQDRPEFTEMVRDINNLCKSSETRGGPAQDADEPTSDVLAVLQVASQSVGASPASVRRELHDEFD